VSEPLTIQYYLLIDDFFSLVVVIEIGGDCFPAVNALEIKAILFPKLGIRVDKYAVCIQTVCAVAVEGVQQRTEEFVMFTISKDI
jgi:hypothetical protein